MPPEDLGPGVYIEELPFGRSIIGVSTSITAFVDFFKRGPVNIPQRIASFSDFERVFGGLDAWSAASYGLQQYFLNGGQVAYVVRVMDVNAMTAALTLTDGTDPVLRIEASSPGEWANDCLRVSVSSATLPDEFNLQIDDVAADNPIMVLQSEVYEGLSMDPNSVRYVLSVINPSSRLIRVHKLSASHHVPVALAAESSEFTSGGSDGDMPGSGAWISTSGSTFLKGSPTEQTGLYALDRPTVDQFNLLCIPAAADLDPDQMIDVYRAALDYAARQRAFLILDIPSSVTTSAEMLTWQASTSSLSSINAAVYYPRVVVADELQAGAARNIATSGTVAGVYARTDMTRGVWKAPAGTDAVMHGVELAQASSDQDSDLLNPRGINVLRSFQGVGNVIWGARTLAPADSEYKYVSVRRTALYIERSLYEGLKWVVFEPNDEPLWSQIRSSVETFMLNLWRQGALQGDRPNEAYFVKCDRETMTQDDLDQGTITVMVGFAMLRPAEFTVIRIQGMTATA